MIALRALVVSARGGGRLWRAGPLTPYDAEVIGEDARRAGPGARLDLSVRAETTEASCVQIRERFAWLADWGVTVRVHASEPHRHTGGSSASTAANGSTGSRPRPRTAGRITSA